MFSRPLVAIVDDDQSLREATSNLLQAAGFSTATFADAETFLKSAGEPRAACLVTDMRMPGMSGLQLHQHLVASGAAIPTPGPPPLRSPRAGCRRKTPGPET